MKCFYEMGIVRDGICPAGIVRWELSGMGIVRDGNCPVGVVRDGNCPGWELSGMGTVHLVGIVRDGNCPGWELSGYPPKPIERQSVSTWLRVFSDETIEALETHRNTDQEKIQGTIQFLKIIVSFWKIVNVKGIDADIRVKDDLRGVIRSPDDESLKILLQIADMSDKLKGKSKRERQLTKDTSTDY